LYEQEQEQMFKQGEVIGLQKGEVIGLQKGEAKLVLRLINRRFGEIPQNLTETIQKLSVEQLENLGEALLDFESQTDLIQWLNHL
jgi:predicted transposase YdaD